MSPEEWLQVVDAVNAAVGYKWTPDRAVRYARYLIGFDLHRVLEAVERVTERGLVPDARLLRAELVKSPWGVRIESRHRELFPRGCPNRTCDVCVVDTVTTIL